MSWEPISNMKPSSPATEKVPPMGVSVASHGLKSRGGKPVRYIKIGIGPKLASALCIVGEHAGLRLSLGGGKFAGRVALSVDNASDCFRARKAKGGGYILTINQASASGLFAMTFAPFAAMVEMQPPERGKPPLGAFRATDAMLAADD